MYTIDVVLEEMFKELTLFFLFLCVFCFFVSCQDVATGMCTPLLAVASCGVTLIKWSPSGHYVFAATLSKVVRVWETKTWTGERWYTYLCGVCFFILLIHTVLLTLLLFSFEHFLLHGFVVLLVVVLLLLLLLLLLPTGRFPLDLAKVLVGILKEHCCWRPWRVVLTCGRLVSLLGLCFFNVSFVSSDSFLFPFNLFVSSIGNASQPVKTFS